MFCQKCGSQLLEDAAFCQKCGAKFAGNDVEAQTPVNEPVQTVSTASSPVSQGCIIRFIPRKVFGQWLLRKAAIDIDGNTYKTKIKKPIDFNISSGQHEIFAYADYLGKSCKTQCAYNFEQGKQYLIRYKSSWLDSVDNRNMI